MDTIVVILIASSSQLPSFPSVALGGGGYWCIKRMLDMVIFWGGSVLGGGPGMPLSDGTRVVRGECEEQRRGLRIQILPKEH